MSEEHSRVTTATLACCVSLAGVLAGCGMERNPVAARESRAIARMRELRALLADAIVRCGEAPASLAELNPARGASCLAQLSPPPGLSPLLVDGRSVVDGYEWEYQPTAAAPGTGKRSTYTMRAVYVAMEGSGRALRIDERGTMLTTAERGGMTWTEVGP